MFGHINLLVATGWIAIESVPNHKEKETGTVLLWKAINIVACTESDMVLQVELCSDHINGVVLIQMNSSVVRR